LTGTLLGIAIKPIKGLRLIEYDTSCVGVEYGLFGDCRGSGGKNRKRQITVLTREGWRDACYEATGMRYIFLWTDRRANLYTSGLKFNEESVGSFIMIGDEVVLEITGETTPCKRMDEAYMGLQKALKPEWRGGVTCRVIRGGKINKGDIIKLNKNKDS
jgi:MOSC domain-containing protein YiiM